MVLNVQESPTPHQPPKQAENKAFMSKFRQALTKFEKNTKHSPKPRKKKLIPFPQRKMENFLTAVPKGQDPPNKLTRIMKTPELERKSDMVFKNTHEGMCKPSAAKSDYTLLPGNVATQNHTNPRGTTPPDPSTTPPPTPPHIPTPSPVLPIAENLSCYQSNSGRPLGLPGEQIRYVDSSTGTSLRNVAPLFKGARLKKHSKVSNPATNTSTNLHNPHNPLRTPAPAQPKTDPPESYKLQGNLAPQKHLSKIEEIKLKLKLSEEVKMTESGDVAKSTITPTRRQPKDTKNLEDNKEDSLPIQGVQKMQKMQKEKLNVRTVSFERVVDNNVEFRNRSTRKLKTATLQEDDLKGRQPVAQDSHCSSKITNTAVQARYRKNPQEMLIPQILNDDKSALLSSSALLLPPR